VIEASLYFLVAEAITNANKYAQGTRVAVSIHQQGPIVICEIADDGVGGADASAGSGLRGLADRVEALEGRLEIVSPPGEGTLVAAELPCA
jgi:signal transduction histidine kinase